MSLWSLWWRLISCWLMRRWVRWNASKLREPARYRVCSLRAALLENPSYSINVKTRPSRLVARSVPTRCLTRLISLILLVFVPCSTPTPQSPAPPSMKSTTPSTTTASPSPAPSQTPSERNAPSEHLPTVMGLTRRFPWNAARRMTRRVLLLI